MEHDTQAINESSFDIAVIGMAGRFPGAKNIEEFWSNLKNGVESISHFSDDELRSSGVPESLINDPKYVKAKGVVDNADLFDADFFGFNPREAEMLDPQHRMFLECAWEALEDACYNPSTYAGLIGIFGGARFSQYLSKNLESNPEIIDSVGRFQTMMGNDKDFLNTRVAYKLNLRGPAITVQSACSTSLVAVHLACQSLLNGECDVALAGGTSVYFPQVEGYLYQDGGIRSLDGKCRAFDAKADGLVPGNGMGLVVLKRLEDALEDGDRIDAIVKSSAVNNDGSAKIGYTAPSVEGVSQVVRAAQAMAEIDPATISYVEAHGSGTNLGDPIEVAGLSQAFRLKTDKNNYCAIGSIKTNIGHLDVAAGIAGFIKTVLIAKHKEIPPSLHYENPNPEIDFVNNPFFVNDQLRKLISNHGPARLAVNSLGLGGTNAHVILEEAPATEQLTQPSAKVRLMTLSAKTAEALDQATENFINFLKEHPDQNLADIEYSLQVGRAALDYRKILLGKDAEELIAVFEKNDNNAVFTGKAHFSAGHPIIFMFPGLGDQYVNMGLDLYANHPVFKQNVDLCAEVLRPHLGVDIREVLYPDGTQVQPKEIKQSGIDLRKMLLGDDKPEDEATKRLNQTNLLQPVLFTIEYALAKLWMHWGVQPTGMLCHSLGEYVAACLAGVFSLEDGLALLAGRSKMINELPKGAMLAVNMEEEALSPMLEGELSISLINSANLCVVAGPEKEVAQFEEKLTEKEVLYRKVKNAHAVHSKMMTPIVEPLIDIFEKVELKPPSIPFLSNVTGTWITNKEATDPKYWARHSSEPVRFNQSLYEIWKEQKNILIEVGPGQTLGALAMQHPAKESKSESLVVSSLRPVYNQQSDMAFLLKSLGMLWSTGAYDKLENLYVQEKRNRVALPTYPFQRKRYWIEPKTGASQLTESSQSLHKSAKVDDWLYNNSWKRTLFRSEKVIIKDLENSSHHEKNGTWLLFDQGTIIGSKLRDVLQKHGKNVIAVKFGEEYSKIDEQNYQLHPDDQNGYHSLFKELLRLEKVPHKIIHLWNVGQEGSDELDIARFERHQQLGVFSLLHIVQSIEKQNLPGSIQIGVVTNQVHDVTGEELLQPAKATLLGPCKVITQEYSNITCLNIDIAFIDPAQEDEKLALRLIGELLDSSNELMMAYRGNYRWLPVYDRCEQEPGSTESQLKVQGTYLLVGTLEESSLVLAKHLVKAKSANLVLLTPHGLQLSDQWQTWLEDKDLGPGKVELTEADLFDPQSTALVITKIKKQHQQIDGLIFDCGVDFDSRFSMISEGQQNQMCHQLLASKAHRLIILDKFLQEWDLDFCLLVSSLTPILGGLGLFSYASADGFLDAYASKMNRLGHNFCFAVNWDIWRFEKMQSNNLMGRTVAELGVTPEESIKVFEKSLQLKHYKQVVVSTGNLDSRIAQWVDVSSLHTETKTNGSNDLSYHSRPQLQTDFVAPQNETEELIADAWQDVLGIEKIGVNDDFSELGGHSLLAIQIISRLRTCFGVQISLKGIFDAPTVAKLALHIEQLIIAEIEAMSDEEARQLSSEL